MKGPIIVVVLMLAGSLWIQGTPMVRQHELTERNSVHAVAVALGRWNADPSRGGPIGTIEIHAPDVDSEGHEKIAVTISGKVVPRVESDSFETVVKDTEDR